MQKERSATLTYLGQTMTLTYLPRVEWKERNRFLRHVAPIVHPVTIRETGELQLDLA